MKNCLKNILIFTILVFSLTIVETLSKDLIIVETLIFASLGKVVGINWLYFGNVLKMP